MVKVGDKVTERLDSISKTLTGEVVYIHPKRRFYTVRFQMRDDSFRESFSELKISDDWRREEVDELDHRSGRHYKGFAM